MLSPKKTVCKLVLGFTARVHSRMGEKTGECVSLVKCIYNYKLSTASPLMLSQKKTVCKFDTNSSFLFHSAERSGQLCV